MRVEEIHAHLRSIDDRGQTLANLQIELERRISTLQDGLGERLLNGDDDGFRQLQDVETQHRKVTLQLDALDRRRAEMRSQLPLAELAELRESIARERAGMEKHLAAVNAQLEKLSSLEEVRFDECIVNAQRLPDGKWFGAFGGLSAPPPYLSPSEIRRDPSARESGYASPLSRRWRDRIDVLEKKASDLERKCREPESSKGTPTDQPTREHSTSLLPGTMPDVALNADAIG